MFAVFSRYLGRHNFRFGGDQSLANFPGLLVTFLTGNLHRSCHGDVLTLLDGNVDALLALHLDWDRDTLLGGDVLADLLALVVAGPVLQVGDPALQVLDTLTLLSVGRLYDCVTAGRKRITR